MRGWPLVILLCCACPDAATSSAQAARPVASAAAPDAGPAVTAASLDAWLQWQQALARLPSPTRADAGPGALLERARQEARLLSELGLTSATADQVEDVVAAVVAERSVARLTGARALDEFRASLEHLPPERRAKAEEAMAVLQAKSAPATLGALEARFGAEAVRLVLTREEEVTKTWDTLLDAQGD